METLSFSAFAGSPHKFSFLQGYYESENPSTASTPFVSAPSSPGKNGPTGFYFSAPTSPTWATRTEARGACYASTDLAAVVPFSWEEKPGTPKRGSEASEAEERSSHSLTGSDFEFSARFLEFEEPPMSPTPMSSANELFLNGQIRPLRPPPRLQQPLSVKQLLAADGSSFDCPWSASCPVSAPQSPRSPLKNGQRGIMKGSMCRISDPQEEVFDPFALAMAQMRKTDDDKRHRRTRSLSPLKIFNWDELASKSSVGELEAESTEPPSNADKKEVRKRTSRRWTLKDLFHRSGGEGRAQSQEGSRRWPDSSSRQSSRGSRRSESSQSSVDWEKDSTRSTVDVHKSTSAPINGTALGMKTSRRSPKGSVSPHELHYTKQRAQTEELKKKTFLPYRQGLLGCLGFSSKSYRTMTSISNALQPVS